MERGEEGGKCSFVVVLQLGNDGLGFGLELGLGLGLELGLGLVITVERLEDVTR